jgi:hypothetical protein
VAGKINYDNVGRELRSELRREELKRRAVIYPPVNTENTDA